MSILHVENLKGLTTGSNANKVIVPSGQTLDASDGTIVPSAGQIVQTQTRVVANSSLTTSSSSLVAVTNWYVDITPTKSTNLLVWKTSMICGTTTVGGYMRFAIYNANTSSQWSSNAYIGANGYNSVANQWMETPVLHANTAGTTAAMRLQLYVLITGGASWDNQWSTSDSRLIEVMEIEQ